jgi:glucose 1-dehydrogenase
MKSFHGRVRKLCHIQGWCYVDDEIQLAPHKIRVNAIAPGAIKTHINYEAWNTPEAEKNLLTLIPYGRVGETYDIGKAAVWLASDESDHVTGISLYADGGMTLYHGFSTNG